MTYLAGNMLAQWSTIGGEVTSKLEVLRYCSLREQQERLVDWSSMTSNQGNSQLVHRW